MLTSKLLLLVYTVCASYPLDIKYNATTFQKLTSTCITDPPLSHVLSFKYNAQI